MVVLGCGGSSPRNATTSSTSGSQTEPPPGQPTLVDPPAQEQLACAVALADVAKYAGEPLGPLMVRHCDEDSWSIDARACFKREPASAPQPCMDELTNEQRKQLGEDIERTIPSE
jgi:hypothetical protein